MQRLHGGNDAQLRKPRDVIKVNYFDMFDPVAAVARANCVAGCLIAIKGAPYTGIAGGMNSFTRRDQSMSEA